MYFFVEWKPVKIVTGWLLGQYLINEDSALLESPIILQIYSQKNNINSNSYTERAMVKPID